MILAFVIGNDEIVFGCMGEGGEELFRTVLSTDARRTAHEYAAALDASFRMNGISAAQLDGAICASVMPGVTEKVRDAVKLLCGKTPYLIGGGIKIGLDIRTDNPKELGGDLVAAAVGAVAKYQPPLIIIDFGTATVFSAIDAKGAFIGCAISPGVSVSSSALSSAAGLLPSISQSRPGKCIGTQTVESMQSGLIYGVSAMIDGMTDRMSKEMGCTPQLIATGNGASDILPYCQKEIKEDQSLALYGLWLIYEKNRKKKK